MDFASWGKLRFFTQNSFINKKRADIATRKVNPRNSASGGVVRYLEVTFVT